MDDFDDLILPPGALGAPLSEGPQEAACQARPGDPNPPPSDTAPPLLWALWYLEQGLWPLPIRDRQDLQQWRESIVRQRVEEETELLAEGEEISLEVLDKITEESIERTERGSKHTFVRWRRLKTQPTISQVRRWWETRPERGIALLTGPRRGIAAIDVDTTKGGDASPWEADCACVAVTPSGGVHCVYREAEVRSTTSELALGVDTRGLGGLIAAPAGSASPRRRWLRWGALQPFPEAEGKRLHPSRPRDFGGVSTGSGSLHGVSSGNAPGAPAEDDELADLFVPASREERGFTHAVSGPAVDGERHAKVAVIMGLLARPRPLPRDAVEVSLLLLADWCEYKDLAGEARECLRRAWAGELLSSQRSESFAMELVTIWNTTRCSPPWPPSKVHDTVRGLWSTASTREAERRVETELTDDEVSETLDHFLPSRARLYSAEDYAHDRRRGLLPIDYLPHWANHRGEIDKTVSTGHGWGEFLNLGLGGGLAAGYLLALGAEQAKGGKTSFVEQLLFGVALRSLAVLSGKAGGPVIVPYYLGEMWQGAEEGAPPAARQITHRDMARWLGVDGNLFRRGDESGGSAPGIQRLAKEIGADPDVLARQILEQGDAELGEGLFRRARELMIMVNVRSLLSGHEETDRSKRPVDHRRGVPLLRALREAIKADVARKAEAWNRKESEVWPLVFIDPIQRYQGTGDNAVSSLDEFVEEVRAFTDELKAITIFTSDTNKDSAKGGVPKDATPFARAAWVFRGSYKILHLPDAALVLSVAWPEEDNGEHPIARVWVALNRWGKPTFNPAYFKFHADCGRFEPIDGPPVDLSSVDIGDFEDVGIEELAEDKPRKPPPRKRGRFAKRERAEG